MKMLFDKIKKIFLNPNIIFLHIKRKWLFFFHFDWSEAIESNKSIKHLLNTNITSSTVIIVEPNTYHAEILPGYSNYFQLLGIEVIILLRKENYDSDVFARYPIENRPRLFVMNPFGMKRILKSKFINNIDYVFISSNIYGERNGFWGIFFDYLKFVPKCKNECLVVEHNIKELFIIQSKHIELNKIFALTPYTENNVYFPMLNPHYFGNVKINKSNREKVFITVGAINNRNRNFSQLLIAVNGLISKGIIDFKVLVIGKIENENFIEDLPQQIVFLGYANFDVLFRKMEESDFFLPLLDSTNIGNQRYLNGTTSGSKQLIFGFRKIPIIYNDFASVYGFTNENAIIQNTDDLSLFMERAVKMDDNEYLKMQNNLELLANNIYQESLQNLKSKLKK